MKAFWMLLLLTGCSTAPIRLVTYDADVRWDHDQDHICHFTAADKHLDCYGARRTIEAVLIEMDKPKR